jgi:hypothetical protein
VKRAAASIAATLVLVGSFAYAHDQHPHPPGSPEDHPMDAPPPEVTNETLPDEQPDTEPGDYPPATPNAAPQPKSKNGATLPPPPPASADDEGWRPRSIDDNTWRRRIRDGEPTEGNPFLDPAHFWLEIRFGPYSPAVDDEPGLTGTPYADYFGDDPLFYFGLEVDWTPIYIPYVVSIGPGFGWGWTHASGKAKVVETGADAESDTGLTIFPMHVSAIGRFDGPLRELGIPLVPYIKFGLGFGLWTASGPSGTSSVEGKTAEGSSLGPHIALGGALALNGFDRSTAMSLREATGVRYAYLYGEWMYDDLGAFNSEAMYVGTSTVVVGLAADF